MKEEIGSWQVASYMDKSVQWIVSLVVRLVACSRLVLLGPPCVPGFVFVLFLDLSVASFCSAAFSVYEVEQLPQLAGDGPASTALSTAAFMIELILSVPARVEPVWRFGPFPSFVPGPGEVPLPRVSSLLVLLLEALLDVAEEVVLGSCVGLMHHAFSEVGLVHVVVVGQEAEPQHSLEAQLVVGSQLGPLQFLLLAFHHLLERHLLVAFCRCLHDLPQGVGQHHLILEGDRAVRVVVEVYSHVVRPEVLLNFGLGEEVNAVEQDGVVADLQRRTHVEHHLSSLYVVAVLFEGEVVEELEQSASEDAVLLLVSSRHGLLDGLAEGLPLGAAVGEFGTCFGRPGWFR